jgi:glycosyltransferase involved in cell wall biosynthesis
MPRIAMLLADALASLPGVEARLSLSANSELLRSKEAPHCDLIVRTYHGAAGFVMRAASAPLEVRYLSHRIDALQADIAVCVHPGPLDLLMVSVLHRLRIPFVAVVHDADLHPGDGLPAQMWLQRKVYRRAAALAALTDYVADRVRALGLVERGARPVFRLNLPPMSFPVSPVAAMRGDGDGFRLLMFGRLLEYKGLDLFSEALARLAPRGDFVVRVVGKGPESAALRALAALPGVTVENRWVAEEEIGGLLSWADAVVLPYREASQSGVAAAAMAAGRRVLATSVGGLPEQLSGYEGAIICRPQADSLSAGLQLLLERRHEPVPPLTASISHAWNEMAMSLCRQINLHNVCSIS